VLQVREHTSIPFPSIIFTFRLAIESIKELGVRHGIFQNANVHFSMVLMSKPFSKVKNLPCLGFFFTKPCTSFKCLVNNHLAQYVIIQVPILHFDFNPTLIHYLSFQAILSGKKGASG